MLAKLNEVFGRMRNDDNVDILYINDGERVDQMNVDGVYPVSSQFSARYSHVGGIILTVEQCQLLNIEIEYIYA
jgi:hypothetical protein